MDNLRTVAGHSSGPASDGTLDDTGERMVPEKSHSSSFWQHIYRYRFATKFVDKKRVLDIACGEGYGTDALMKAGAASVVGVDISAEACVHAINKYGVDARPGNAENIPLSDQSIDVIVSFETIEHIQDPAAFLDECIRVLAPSGILIISTPNKEVFSEAEVEIPFHCSEMSEGEFISLLEPRFAKWQIYTQGPISAGFWSVRSLAAESSLWFQIRGPARLREMLREAFCTHIRGEAKQRYRLSPAETILAEDGHFSNFLNPYVVRKHSQLSREQPAYFVAVAVRSANAARLEAKG